MSEPTAVERAAWWAAEARAATTARDEAILEAVAAGTSARAVARAVGLSHTQVRYIVRRAAAA